MKNSGEGEEGDEEAVNVSAGEHRVMVACVTWLHTPAGPPPSPAPSTARGPPDPAHPPEGTALGPPFAAYRPHSHSARAHSGCSGTHSSQTPGGRHTHTHSIK